MSDSPQSYENHAKLVPMFHFVAFGLLMVAFLWFTYRMVTDFSVGRMMFVVLIVGVILVAFFARLFALGVQDRVIRLEEQLRMARLLSPELQGRIGEISTEHFIGLRFASDEELEELTTRVLNGEFPSRKEVKQAVRNWRADNERI